MKHSIMFYIRESHAYAYAIGFYERARYVDGFGRTHQSDEGWNVAYDRGANLADIIFRTGGDW